MNNHHEEPEKENNERWLLTYSDLITLLLAFFIILYSMANVDKEKFKRLMESLGSQFGAGGNAGAGQTSGLSNETGAGGASITFPPLDGVDLGITVSPGATPNGVGNAIEIDKMEQVKGEVEDMLNAANLGNEVKVSLTEQGLEISINAEVLFDIGSAMLKPKYTTTVGKITNVLSKLKGNQIIVEGHTDNVPIKTYQFPSNWYLSTARAICVLDLIMKNHELDPNKLSVQGYGDSRPIASNSTPEGRAKNRRVNIIILKDAYNAGIDNSTPPPAGSDPETSPPRSLSHSPMPAVSAAGH